MSVSPPYLRALQPMASRLRAAPHRDCTHVPYATYLTDYIRALQHTYEEAAAASAPQGTMPDTHTHLSLQLTQMKRLVDEMLLRSLFARRWTEVPLPGDTPHSTTAASSLTTCATGASHLPHEAPAAASGSDSGSTAGEHLSSSSSTSLWWMPPAAATMPRTVPLSKEVLTPGFLAEPLLGPVLIQSQLTQLRTVSPSFSPLQTSTASVSAGGPYTVAIYLPFSTLWQLKEEAHARPGAAARSLQEREARRSVLHSLHHLLQLQQHVHRTAAPLSESEQEEQQGSLPPTVMWRVWRPSEEFDAMRQLATWRARQPPQPSAAASCYPSLGQACEDPQARLAYLSQALSGRSSTPVSDDDSAANEGDEGAAALLAPAAEHARYRQWGARALREESRAKALLPRPGLGAGAAVAAADGRGGGGPSLHTRAMRECEAVVRRLTLREENIRQSFTLK